jgi:hypothetical protein
MQKEDTLGILLVNYANLTFHEDKKKGRRIIGLPGKRPEACNGTSGSKETDNESLVWAKIY